MGIIPVDSPSFISNIYCVYMKCRKQLRGYEVVTVQKVKPDHTTDCHVPQPLYKVDVRKG